MGTPDASSGPSSVYDDGEAVLYSGDCRAVMAALPADSVDTIITDPPYDLLQASRKGSPRRNVGKEGNPYAGGAARAGGFMGKAWDATGVAFEADTWREALRVAKPGALLLAFGGTRTYHRMVCAIEGAGWEVRDCLMWLYGQGFPKSLDIAKALDKAAGAEREVVGRGKAGAAFHYGDPGEGGFGTLTGKEGSVASSEWDVTAPATDVAKTWDGWGTALKPAWEPIVLAMKPLDGTYAENALKHGVAGLHIDGGRVSTAGEEVAAPQSDPAKREGVVGSDLGISGADREKFQAAQRESAARTNALGRWPSNLLLGHHFECRLKGVKRVRGSANHHRSETSIGGHGTYQGGEARTGHDYVGADGKEAVEAWDCHPGCPAGMLDAQSGETTSRAGNPRAGKSGEGWGMTATGTEHDDRGGASRFFYTSKATGRDKGNVTLPALPMFGVEEEEFRNTHPTVKPTDLMEYLCRLTATPTGGVILDPFAGSGTTLVAAGRAGRRSIGIEISEEYCDIVRRRLDDERRTR